MLQMLLPKNELPESEINRLQKLEKEVKSNRDKFIIVTALAVASMAFFAIGLYY